MPYIVGAAANPTDFYFRLKHFILGVGFIGQASFTGVGNGKLIDIRLPNIAYAGEKYMLNCDTVSPYGGSFGVVSSVRGTLLDTNVNSVYRDPGIEFYIDFGSTNFAVNDKFEIKIAEYSALSKPPLNQLAAGIQTKTEVITLTCTSAGQALIPTVQPAVAAEFSVVGSVTGSMGTYVQGNALTHPAIRLTLDRGDVSSVSEQYSVGDTIKIYTTANELTLINQQWETLREFGSAGSQDLEWIFKGKGLAGDDEIICSILSGMVLSGQRGYAPGLTHSEQPGQMPFNRRPSLGLWGGVIPYWISVTGRRIVIKTRSNTYYMDAYMGLGIPWGSPKYQPYMLCVGGSQKGANWATAAAGNTNYWSAGWFSLGAGQNQGEVESQMQAMDRDGNWQGWVTGYSTGSVSTHQRFIWPTWQGMAIVGLDLDGGSPLYPITLGPDLGQLDGIYATVGFSASEDIIWNASAGKKYVVTALNWRTSPFAAMELV